MSGFIRDTVYKQLSKIGLVVIPPEQITAIANQVKGQISIPDTSTKVDKVSGKSLVDNTKISQIHAQGSDDQDLSHLITDQDARLTDARDPKTHSHSYQPLESGKGLSKNDLTDALKTGYDSAVTLKHSNSLDHSNASDHSHSNKSTLDTYTQTEANLASAVSLKHSNSLDHAAHSDDQDLSGKVDKIGGKGLSTNDYTTAEQTKLAGLSNYVAPAFNSPYRTLLDSSGSHSATKTANTYGLGQGDIAAVTGTGTLYPLNVLNIVAADYPTIDGKAAKLRVRFTINCNDVAPFTGTFVCGLHPVTRPATSGGAGLCIYTIGAAVAGSICTGTNLTADSQNGLVGADFALPADGHYVLAFVTNGTMATSSHVHISASLQIHNA